MRLVEYLNRQQVICVYPGKFQPMHKGHYELYELLVKKFGEKNVYISTADLSTRDHSKKYKDSHIFSFVDKVEFMNKMFDIPERQIIQTKSPMFPTDDEIPIRGDYALVMVSGEKDADRFSKMGYIKYSDDIALESHKDVLYYYSEVNANPNINATDVRNFLRSDKDIEAKKKYFTNMYGKYDEEMFNKLLKALDNE